MTSFLLYMVVKVHFFAIIVGSFIHTAGVKCIGMVIERRLL